MYRDIAQSLTPSKMRSYNHQKKVKHDRQMNLLSPFNMSVNIKIFKSVQDFYAKVL